jgi:DNA polymerase III subunit epsilon
MSAVSESLSQIEVLVVDCQATGAAPHGRLLEIGWAHGGTRTTPTQARLIALPHGEHIPPAVARLTGMSERMVQDAVDAQVAWRELASEAASLSRQPAPTVIHFSRFEQPFLSALAGGTTPLDIVCTRRVNSYFRKQHGIRERTLEMLSQARGIAFDVTPSALEAALFEPDEIKRHRPPYNVALTAEDRPVWFAPPDLSARSAHPSSQCPLGPFPSAGLLDEFGALAAADRRALGSGRWRPGTATFEGGYARLCAAHTELLRPDLGAHERLLQLGTRLWREGRRDHDVDADEETRAITTWTPELVQRSLEWLSLRGALARRRAIWLTRLVDSSVVWREPGDSGARLIVIEEGEVALSAAVDANAPPPIPPGYRRPVAARREALTLASFDRLRVLTTELKRLIAAGAPVALRLGVGPALDESRLASALWWV